MKSMTVDFNLEHFVNLYFISSGLVHSSFMNFVNFNLIDFMFKYSTHFKNSNFINSKFKQIVNFNFTMSKLYYFRDYFAVIAFINSNFERSNLFDYLGR